MVALDPNPSHPVSAQNPLTQKPPAMDAHRLGASLVVAASLIHAIRTASWSREQLQASGPEWEAELDHSIALAHRIFAHLDAQSPFLFRR